VRCLNQPLDCSPKHLADRSEKVFSCARIHNMRVSQRGSYLDQYAAVRGKKLLPTQCINEKVAVCASKYASVPIRMRAPRTGGKKAHLRMQLNWSIYSENESDACVVFEKK
jgi:hypothetical protein